MMGENKRQESTARCYSRCRISDIGYRADGERVVDAQHLLATLQRSQQQRLRRVHTNEELRMNTNSGWRLTGDKE